MDTRVLAAVTLIAASLNLRAAAPEPFVVHEWGTFTSMQAGAGTQLRWSPTLRTDLPGFVYSRPNGRNGLRNVSLLETGDKGSIAGYLLMETPVIYFYSEGARDVNVRVDFPKGVVTEWYPRATHVGPHIPMAGATLDEAATSKIEWRGVKVLPRQTTEITADQLIRVRGDAHTDHYYAARETDANFVRVKGAAGAEHERDLFYRGVGFEEAPLNLAVDTDENTLRLFTNSTEPLTDLFVVTVRNGKLRYQTADRVTSDQGLELSFDARPFEPLAAAREKLKKEMVAALERQGLYAKEARAMVNTWQNLWFASEGTRVLYLLPQAWTDKTLPLQVSPRPDRIVRVMVGRSELVVPAEARKLTLVGRVQ